MKFLFYLWGAVAFYILVVAAYRLVRPDPSERQKYAQQFSGFKSRQCGDRTDAHQVDARGLIEPQVRSLPQDVEEIDTMDWEAALPKRTNGA